MLSLTYPGVGACALPPTGASNGETSLNRNDLPKADGWVDETFSEPVKQIAPTAVPKRTGGSAILFESYSNKAKQALHNQSLEEAANLYQQALEQTGSWAADDKRTISTIDKLIEINNTLNRADKVHYYMEELRNIGQCLYLDPERLTQNSKKVFIANADSPLARADALMANGKLDDAEKIYRSLYTSAVPAGQTAVTYKPRIAIRLVGVLSLQHQTARAEELLKPLLKETEATLSVSPTSTDCQLAMAMVLQSLSILHREKGEFGEAEALCIQGLRYADWAQGKYGRMSFYLQNEMCKIHQAQKQPLREIKDLRQAIDIAKHDKSGVTEGELRRTLLELANMLKQAGLTADASSYLKQAEKIAPTLEPASIGP